MAGPRAYATAAAIASPRAIAWRVYLVAAAGAALLLPIRHVTLAGEEVDLTFALAAAALVLAHVVYTRLLQRSLQRHSFSWYVRTHAAHFPADSRLTCRHCGGGHIVQHSLTGVNFLAQACADCKKTLFFRPERRARGRTGRLGHAGNAGGDGHPAAWLGPERRQSRRHGPTP